MKGLEELKGFMGGEGNSGASSSRKLPHPWDKRDTRDQEPGSGRDTGTTVRQGLTTEAGTQREGLSPGPGTTGVAQTLPGMTAEDQGGEGEKNPGSHPLISNQLFPLAKDNRKPAGKRAWEKSFGQSQP